MGRKAATVPLICVLAVCACQALAGGGDFALGGYVQFMPVHTSARLPAPAGRRDWLEWRAQNRLNLRWEPTPAFTGHAGWRLRFFGGDPVRELPGYADLVGRDEGLVDLSWTIAERDDWFLHAVPDRLYGEWDAGEWNLRAGRQRVNWGVNAITNPNDIFNLYSIYEFDYPERPGADAIRIQRFLGFGSRLEVAASPARDSSEHVAAALYAFHLGGHDVQVLGGYYRERLACGAGWAYDLGGAGLKGEAMHYADCKRGDGGRRSDVVAALSVDYMFPNRLFVVVEVLYNQAGGGEAAQPGGRLRADNPSFSRYQLATQASYPIHPLLDGALAVLFYPDEEAVFLSPSLTWSVAENLDLKAVGQVFAARGDSVFSRAANLAAVSLTYHF